MATVSLKLKYITIAPPEDGVTPFATQLYSCDEGYMQMHCRWNNMDHAPWVHVTPAPDKMIIMVISEENQIKELDGGWDKWKEEEVVAEAMKFLKELKDEGKLT